MVVVEEIVVEIVEAITPTIIIVKIKTKLKTGEATKETKETKDNNDLVGVPDTVRTLLTAVVITISPTETKVGFVQHH